MNRPFSLAGKRVWVAGHRGMVGSALVRRLEREDCEILTIGRDRLDLTRRADVEDWMAEARPQAVFVAAAKVGGILANDTQPVDFLEQNLLIGANVIGAAHRHGVEKLMYLAASCIYPRAAEQPVREDALLSGPLEPTNQWYAVGKIAGIKLAQAYRRQHGADFVSVAPANLYGPNDNFDLAASHVVPALIRKAHEAKTRGDATIGVWGTGSPLREFMHVDDFADAGIFAMKTYSDEPILNVGSNQEVSILELTRMVCAVVGFSGEIVCDPSKPDGMPRKLIDSTRLGALGWRPSIGLADGLRDAYRWFLDNGATA